MILYNTLMGVFAGIIILTMSGVIFRQDDRLTMHGIVLLIAGIPLAVLSFLMAVTWPLKVNPAINIIFAEPNLFLAVLAIAAGICLIKGYNKLIYTAQKKVMYKVVFVLGLMLSICSIAIFRHNIVGDAPSIEPITGQFKGWENITFGIGYLAAGIGTMAVWFGDKPWAQIVSSLLWKISGVFFLGFSLLNYYTHTGMLMCANGGECNSF